MSTSRSLDRRNWVRAQQIARANPDAPTPTYGGEQCDNCACADWDHRAGKGPCFCGRCQQFKPTEKSANGQTENVA